MGTRDTTADDLLSDTLAEYYDDPLGYVLFAFPWDTYQPIQQVELQSPWKEMYPNSTWGPDVWACEFLHTLGTDVKELGFDGHTAVEPLQYATVSGHGIGKSALVAWLTKWILDTRPLSVGTITANTAEQLKAKTWAEVGKWHRLSVTEHKFAYNSGRGAMNLTHKKHPQDWKCTAQTCREENSEAFAGQHAPAGSSFYIFDEASAVPNKIFEVREGGTTDGQPMVFDFGNGTRNSGRFFEHCAGRLRHRYKVRSIDSRDVALTSKTRIQDWLEDYGEDSDFFKVRVRGMFPSSGSLQFIPTDLVKDAQHREIFSDETYAPLVIGVDVARYGNNESVIFPRLGHDCRSWPARRFQGLNTVQLVGKVIECVREFRALGINCSGLFVDGGGVGGGVIDQLADLGYNPKEVQFGSKAINSKTYRYRSDEMWGNLRDALPRLCLPANNQANGIDLLADLTQREFGYTASGNKIHLETKKDMIARGVASPDLADALALTFAMPIAPLQQLAGLAINPATVKSEYDPINPPNMVN